MRKSVKLAKEIYQLYAGCQLSGWRKYFSYIMPAG